MDCLKGLVELKGCGTSEPDSGLFVNSLPQISLESIEKLADAEQQTYLGAWEDIQTRAIQRIRTDIIAKLAERYRLKQLTQSIDLLKVIDLITDQTAADNTWYGFTARLNFPNSNKFVGSSFHCYYFQELRFYSKAVQTGITFKIFDLQTGEVLFTKSQDLVIGWNRIKVNTRFIAYRLFIATDATDIVSLVSQDISQDALDSFGCACGIYSGQCFSDIRGAKTETLLANVTDEDITFGDNIFGLSAIFSVQCNYHSLVCNNKDLFALPYWYLLGEECMIEKLNSTRRNFFTMMQTEKAQENKTDLNALYKEALDTACSGITLNLGDCCLECNQAVKIVEARM